MEWKDVGDWLKGNAGGVAGLVGSLLVGNVPGAIAAGVGLVTSATGEKEPDAALAQLQGNPDALLKLRELAAQNEASIRDHVLEMERVRLADVADARKRDTAIIAAGRTNMRADLMVLGAVAGLIACLVVLVAFRAQVPGEVVGIVSTVAGIFGACLRDAFQFEFGSSRGSKDSGEALRQIATRQGG
jgi:hypothetical protein